MDIFKFFKTRTRLFEAAFLITIASGTIIFHYLESWTWIQSVYFTVATLTTTGYGDLAPTHESTRAVVTVFILVGIFVMVSLLSTIEARFFAKHPVEHLDPQEEQQYITSHKK